MSAFAKGYPIRGAYVVFRPDRQGRLAPLILVDDRKPLNRLPASETFKRAAPKAAQFGKRRALNIVQRRAATFAVSRGLAVASGPLAAGMLAYEAWDMWTEYKEGGPIPRDPNNAQDMALVWPDGWFVGENTILTREGFGAARAVGVPIWQKGPAFGVRTWDDVEQSFDYYPPVTPQEIVNGVWSRRTQFTLNSDTEWANPQEMGETNRGWDWVRSVEKTAFDAPNPQFANPPRTAPAEAIPHVFPRPGADPFAVPRWRDIPNRQPNPYRSPNEAPQRGPEPSPRPLPVPVAPPSITITVPEPASPPSERPDPLPDLAVPPVTVTPTTTVTREPPGKREKERKVKIKRNGVAQALHKGVGPITETLDFINALYDALPKEYRTGYVKRTYRDKVTGEIKTYYKRVFKPTQFQKMKDLYNHWDKVDLQDAAHEIAMNQLEDKFYGKLGQLQGKLAGKAGMDRGFQFGNWDDLMADIWNGKIK